MAMSLRIYEIRLEESAEYVCRITLYVTLLFIQLNRLNVIAASVIASYSLVEWARSKDI
jgi:hypothetical protein